MVIAVLSGLLMFIGLLLIIANLLYVGYVWEKKYKIPWCITTDEIDYDFYGIISTASFIGIFMVPPINLILVPVVIGLVLATMGMIGLVKLGSKLAHIGFAIKCKKEDK